MEEAGVWSAGPRREKRREGSFEKDAVSGREIYLCSVHLNHMKERKKEGEAPLAYQAKPSASSTFVPPQPTNGT